MAGKEDVEGAAAAGRLGEVVEVLGAVLRREALALASLPPSPDAAGAEKAAKAVKVIADAGRSLVAFAQAAAQAAPDDETPDAGMDMDDEHPAFDGEDLVRRRERLVERFALRPLSQGSAAPGAGPPVDGGHGAALAGAVARGPAPA